MRKALKCFSSVSRDSILGLLNGILKMDFPLSDLSDLQVASKYSVKTEQHKQSGLGGPLVRLFIKISKIFIKKCPPRVHLGPPC